MGMLPLKAVLVSTGVVSMAVMLKLSLPVILDFLTSELPLLWSLLLSWLQPPYLYLLINCIIISIVASSKLQPRVHRDGDSISLVPENFSAPLKIPAEIKEDPLFSVIDGNKEEELVVFGYVDSPLIVKTDPVVTPFKERENFGGGGGGEEEEERENFGEGDEFVISKSTWNTPGKITPVVLEFSPASSPSAEKPPLSARFGQRRTVKSSPEGKTSLRVSRPKKQDTLESTWRTITEGRSMPLKRHLRKSDTFAGASPANSPVRVMKKTDSFAGGNSSPATSGSGRLRREASPSQDELNRRVEAFIKKFNEEMRLQRQESLNQYKEVINSGSRQI